MKKNILRVISLVLVAAMLFAFTACTQKIEIRIVDKDGNDVNLGSVLPAANTGNTETPSVQDTPSSVPDTTAAPVADDTTAAPADDTTTAPAADTTAAPTADTTAAPTADTTAAPAPDTTAAPEPAAPAVPTSKEEILDFYKAAAARVKNNAEAGFEKKEWQVVSNLNITGNGTIDGLVENAVGGYMTKEAEAETQVAGKGSAEAKDKFPGFTLTDYSKVASATIDTSGSTYKISIVMADEDTPMSTGSVLGQVTNSLLYWDSQIKPELDKQSFIKEINEVHVIYEGYKINAEITPDGKFVSLDHLGHINIQIVSAKLGVAFINISLDNKSATMDNFCQYRNFSY